MSNYYKPDISEFYVGFEYERLAYLGDPNGKHVTVTFPCDFIEAMTKMSVLKEYLNVPKFGIRVKYLDKEDIGSIDLYSYEVIDYQEDNFLEFKWFRSRSLKGFYTYTDHMLSIYEGTHDEDCNDCIFRGTIKNKSEFKKLIDQLAA